MPIISEFYEIKTVTPIDSTQLKLLYRDGKCIIVDFKPIIERGGVFSALADPNVFSNVQLGNRGRYIAWGEIDFCADSFRTDSTFEQSPA
jgi:Protein of unknown function (DUF2442)